MSLDIIHPVFDIPEALSVSDVVSHYNTLNFLIKAVRGDLVPCISINIPNVEFDEFTFDFNLFIVKIYSNFSFLGFEGVFTVSPYE